jgi:hypothetical protein
MPNPIRPYIRHVATGFGIAAAFVTMLLIFDIANMWHLVSTSDNGWLAVLLMWLAGGVVFAGVQFALSTMNDDDDDDPHGGKRHFIHHHERRMIPIRVAAGGPHRRHPRR